MNRKQIRNRTGSYYSMLNKLSKNFKHTHEPEAIHAFRVTYKRLNAFLNALSTSREAAGQIDVTKKLKLLYIISGKIRDLHLQAQRIVVATAEEPKPPQGYLNIIQKEKEALWRQLKDILAEDPIAESRKKTDHLLPAHFTADEFVEEAHCKWSDIRRTIATHLWGDDELHMIRRILKEIEYNLDFYTYPEREVLFTAVFKDQDKIKIEEIVNGLGNFHDKCVAIALLKLCWLNKVDSYNRRLLERIKKRWIQEKIILKQKLLKMLMDFCGIRERINTSGKQSFMTLTNVNS